MKARHSNTTITAPTVGLLTKHQQKAYYQSTNSRPTTRALKVGLLSKHQ